MLAYAERRQLTAIATGILQDFLQSATNAFAQRRKVLLIGKLRKYPLIALVAGQPSRPMSPIVGDVERLIAGRDSNGTIAGRGGSRVGIIDTTELLRRLLRIKGNGKKNQ
jgi:hypothetical protein